MSDRETTIERLAAHAATVYERGHEDFEPLVIAVYKIAYRDALTLAWPVIEAAQTTRGILSGQTGRPPSLSLQLGVLTATLKTFDI